MRVAEDRRWPDFLSYDISTNAVSTRGVDGWTQACARRIRLGSLVHHHLRHLFSIGDNDIHAGNQRHGIRDAQRFCRPLLDFP